MYSTLMELKTQIQIAKQELITAAEQWLASERGLSDKDKTNWLAAFSATSRDKIDTTLVEYSVPLYRSNTIKKMPSTSVANEPSTISFIKSIYKCSPTNPDPILIDMAALTTLMDHLHQLEEHLIPREPIDFKPLLLSQAKIQGLALEWPHVKVEEQTVNEYTERLGNIQTQFEEAKKNNDTALNYMACRLEVHIAEFEEILKSCADLLSNTYAMRPDNRYLTTFRSYLPWHQMLRKLATILFEKVSVIDNQKDKEELINEIRLFFKTQIQNDLTELNTLYSEKCEEIEAAHQSMEVKISAMAESLKPGSRRGMQDGLAFNFFRNLKPVPAYVLAIQKELGRESGKSPDAKIDALSGTDYSEQGPG